MPAPAVEQDCSDFVAWRDAQDALDLSSSDLERLLDDDLDGVACNELAQEEYEDGFQQGAEDACSFVWQESPDGVLYYDDTGYEQSDCDGAAPLPDEWEASSTGDPESEGAANGWSGACEDLFAYVGLDALFWGDTIVVSQSDCQSASP